MAKLATDPRIQPVIGRRSNARVRLGIPARLILLDGQRRCRLLNLSVCGAMLGIEPPPAVGSSGILTFADVETFGTVVWVHSKHCGVDFDEHLPLATVTAMRHLASAHPDIEGEREARALRAWIAGEVRVF